MLYFRIPSVPRLSRLFTSSLTSLESCLDHGRLLGCVLTRYEVFRVSSLTPSLSLACWDITMGRWGLRIWRSGLPMTARIQFSGAAGVPCALGSVRIWTHQARRLCHKPWQALWPLAPSWESASLAMESTGRAYLH
ncbi:hypothetical protein BT67DRAFT_158073 [Trichocladium antarcticum]|uniref:Uncharacterized protein n=1 Tax=Trichocladium antarcticum TaxID=1450529 RepID=A0AAN6UEL1_9PEZI|nr:hypothetical protein BT67DRAFT_158073 [Trichocladium antarcticum]